MAARVVRDKSRQAFRNRIYTGDYSFDVGGDDSVADAGQRRSKQFTFLICIREGSVQRIDQQNCHDTERDKKSEADPVLRLANVERISGLEDKIRSAESTCGHRDQARPSAAVPSHEDNCGKERDEWDSICDDGPQEQTQSDRHDDGGYRETVCTNTSSGGQILPPDKIFANET
jgi:hypothetical protein